MSFGERFTETRKKRGFSQEELAELLSTKGPAIGRYERGEAMPSVETAKKIADVFKVSLNYLVGEGMNVSFDKVTLQRLQNVQKLSAPDKDHVYALLDAFLLKCDIQKNFAKP